jgi:hypothetical protein
LFSITSLAAVGLPTFSSNNFGLCTTGLILTSLDPDEDLTAGFDSLGEVSEVAELCELFCKTDFDVSSDLAGAFALFGALADDDFTACREGARTI